MSSPEFSVVSPYDLDSSHTPVDIESPSLFLERTSHFWQQVEQGDYHSLVFLDRSARPFSWVFEAMWEKKRQDAKMPHEIFINTGKKDWRKKYGEGIGSALSEKEGKIVPQFVGMMDEDEYIEIFKRRVRMDFQTKIKMVRELGLGVQNAISNRNVLIVDDIEFEGVQRIFATIILQDLYHPSNIDYFSWESDRFGINIPHGLSYTEQLESFIAVPDNDPSVITNVQRAKTDIRELIFNSSV